MSDGEYWYRVAVMILLGIIAEITATHWTVYLAAVVVCYAGILALGSWFRTAAKLKEGH